MTGPIGVGGQNPLQNLNPSGDEIRPENRGESSTHNQRLEVRRSPSPPIIPSFQLDALLQPRAAELPSRMKALLHEDLNARPTFSDAPLKFALQNMLMEGRLLGSTDTQHMSFEQVQSHLSSIGRDPHPWISGTEDAKKLEVDIENSLHNPSQEAFEAILGKHTKRIGEQLVSYHLLYKEVLDSDLKPYEKKLVQDSHKAFRDYAARQIDSIVNRLPATINAFLDQRLEMAKTAASREGHSEEANRVVTQWETAQQSFTGARGELSRVTVQDNLKPAIQNIQLDELIDKLKADQSSKTKKSQVFFGAGLPQGFASFLHFGILRNLANKDMKEKDFHIAARGFLSGINLGAVHKFVSDVPRAAVQGGLDALFVSKLEKVDPTVVFPDAPRVISVQGRRHTRDDRELAIAQHEVENHRANFKREQRSHYFGTVTGDYEYYLSFGIANAVRATLDEAGTLDGENTLAFGITSGVAGLAAGGAQALGKFNNTYEGIPTHKLSGTQSQTANEIFDKALQDLQFWKGDSADDAIGKVFGAIEGEFITLGLEKAGEMLGNDDIKDKVGRIFITLLGSPGVLYPYLANVGATAKAAAEADGLKEEKASDRYLLPLYNIFDPNRHSRKDREGLTVDEDFNLEKPSLKPSSIAADIVTSAHTIVTGFTQAIPQTLISAKMKAVEKIQTGQRVVPPADQQNTETDRVNRAGFDAADALERGEARVLQAEGTPASASRNTESNQQPFAHSLEDAEAGISQAVRGNASGSRDPV